MMIEDLENSNDEIVIEGVEKHSTGEHSLGSRFSGKILSCCFFM